MRFIQKKFIWRSLPLGILFIFCILFSKLYYDRVSLYSFGDEYNNFIAGYFMVRGRALYSQIFFNHQMLMAQVSYLLQKIFHPHSLYQLVFVHRAFVIAFSCAMSFLLVARFRFMALGTVILFELTKFYLFGNLFLAESLIVYPVIYLFFLCLEKIKKAHLSAVDVILSGIFTWFIIFMREPYIPLAILLYIFILFSRKFSRMQILSLAIFIALSLLSLVSVPLRDFWSQVVLFNATYKVSSDATLTGNIVVTLFRIIFYPIDIFFEGKWDVFRSILLSLSSLYILLMSYSIYKRQYKKAFLILVMVAVSNIRTVLPGTIFYEAFHVTVWYGLFIASSMALLTDHQKQKWTYMLGLCLLSLTGILMLDTQSFIWQKIDKNREFTINYARHYINGEAVHILAKPQQTLFADQWDYLLFFQADTDSSYKYAVYTFATAASPVYQKERLRMLQQSPPDFYYTYCAKNAMGSLLVSSAVLKNYQQLTLNGVPSCLYIKISNIEAISSTQWMQVRSLGYSLQP